MVKTYLLFSLEYELYLIFKGKKIFIGEREDETNDRFTLSHFTWYR